MDVQTPNYAQHRESGIAGTQGVRRVADLLRAIASRGADGARLVDLAIQCQLERPTAHRMLKALVAEGMVARDPVTRRYRLGQLMFELGLAADHPFRVRELCEPSLLRLADRTGDTVFLTLRSGLDTVCIDRKEGAFPIRTLTLDVGTRRPLGIGAGGLALLLPLGDAEIGELLAANAWRLGAYNGMRTGEVLRMVERSRKLGYALNDRQATPGAMSIGLAMRNRYGAPYLAISLGAITTRMQAARQRELFAMLGSEARLLEQRLGSVEAAEAGG
ncbi:MAG: IclR family transcriptional regulator [Burkholderiales bacterium]|nr:IclR family transcriptional regulator [Burkholderiales bacterium]GIK83159.1 MAG: transcriptional regulator [Alphaproteobacteria bacterium]